MPPISGLDYTPMPGEKFEGYNQKEAEPTSAENQGYDDAEDAAWHNLESDDSTVKEKYNDSNVLAQEIGEQINSGSIDLEKAESSVAADNIEGAIETIAADAGTQADTANVEQNIGDDAIRQSYDTAVKAAESAVFADVNAKNIESEIKSGDFSNAQAVEDFAQQAEKLANGLFTLNSGSNANAEQAQKINAAAEQAQEMAAEARQRVEDAKNEYESLSAEEKEDAQAAVEAAELNGTTVEEEREKIEEQKLEEEAEVDPDEASLDGNLDGSIYG